MIKIPKDASNTGKDGYKNEVSVLHTLENLIARDNKSMTIVQDFIAGKTVQAKLKELMQEQLDTGKDKSKEISDLQNQFVDVFLTFLERTGLSRNDVHLKNVLVDNGKVQLIDFAIAYKPGNPKQGNSETLVAINFFERILADELTSNAPKTKKPPKSWGTSSERRTSVMSEETLLTRVSVH